MSNPILHHLKQLDHCLEDRSSLGRMRAVLDKVEKCCVAVEKGMNLGDILSDEANLRSMTNAFGAGGFEVGMQMLLKLAMHGFTVRSMTLTQALDSDRKVDFLHKTFGGWKQFDMLLFFQGKAASRSDQQFCFVNPADRAQWDQVQDLPVGTLVCVYIKTVGAKRSQPQEEVALDRILAAFDLVQNRVDLQGDMAPTPVVRLHPPRPQQAQAPKAEPAPAPSPSKAAAPKPLRRASTAPRIGGVSRSNTKYSMSEPCMAFQVVINKMDTFVHAGNAHLIVTHIQDYEGQIKMFVLRAEKHPVQLDADSIWGAEIRNGETVLYEFFGPKPADDFVKELAKKTNKYTQMDKLGNE